MLENKDYCDLDTSHELWVMGLEPEAYYDGPLILLYEAQKFLREEKGIFLDIGLFNDGVFYYCIRQKENNYWREIYRSFFHDGLFDDHGKFESYEEALSEGIKETINILKDGIGE